MRKFYALLILLTISLACEEIVFVDDISQDTIEILAPTEGSILSAGAIVFSWEDLEYADEYSLQIATPDFESAVQIVQDTTIIQTDFAQILEPGLYQWRVRGENPGYQTLFSTKSFSVEE